MSSSTLSSSWSSSFVRQKPELDDDVSPPTSNDLRLDEPRRLHGRDQELRRMQAFLLTNTVVDKLPSAAVPTRSCIIRGPAGCGKTALCENFRKASLFCHSRPGSRINDDCEAQARPDHRMHHNRPCRHYQSGCRAYFLSGKFEQPFVEEQLNSSGQSSSFFAAGRGALFQALDSLALQLQPEDEKDLPVCLTSYEASILCRAVPRFAKLLLRTTKKESFCSSNDRSCKSGCGDNREGCDDVDNDETGNSNQQQQPSEQKEVKLTATSERLAVTLRTLLRNFCRPHRPVVIFMDDLQWSDPDSCSILAAIMNDKQIENFCFLGAYRDEEGKEEDARTSVLDSILGQDKKDTTVQGDAGASHLEIQLGNLSLDSVTALVSSMIHSDPERTLPLSTVVHHKTAGNPFFVIQFCQTLWSRGLLKYSFGTMRWEWDYQAVESETNITDNVVDVVRARIQSLDPAIGRLLTLAAFLGFYFDMLLLATLSRQLPHLVQSPLENPGATDPSDTEKQVDSGDSLSIDESSFATSLETARQEGLVERAGYYDALSWKFSHDRVQQSMYELVPVGRRRDELHFSIGRHVLKYFCDQGKDTSVSSLDTYDGNNNSKWLLIAANQLNRGSTAIQSESDRLSLIRLNYDAALAAKREAGVTVVARFLSKARELSKARDWELSYDMILSIHSWSAEVELSRGNFAECQEIISTILGRARCQEDTVRALIVNMEMHGAQRDFSTAIKESRKILSILGERLPSSSTFNMVVQLLKTNRAVKNKPDAYFLERKAITEPRYKHIFDVLFKASVYGWSCDPTHTGLCLLRMMQISLSHGVSEHTGFCYSGYGFIMGATGNPKQAYRFGQLALRITNGKSGYAAAALSVYTSLYHFSEPAVNGMEPSLKAYRVGLATGDMFYGTLSLSVYTCLYLFCGLPLSPLVKDARKFGAELKICHQDYALAYVIAQFQLSLNLTGQSDDPLDCSRDALKKHEFFSDKIFLDIDDPSSLTLDYFQTLNAFLLDDLGLAETALRRIMSRKTNRLSGSHFFNYFLMFIDVVVGSAIWKSGSKPRFRRLAKRATNELRGCVKKGMMNCDGIFSLAVAEMALMRRRGREVKVAYDEAIAKLTRTGLVHFAGIANELAAQRMLRLKDQYWFDHYMSQASECYESWGATAKVAQLREKHQLLKSKEMGFECRPQLKVRASSIRGRVRYDSNVDSLTIKRRSSIDRISIISSNELSSSLFLQEEGPTAETKRAVGEQAAPRR